MPGINWLAVIIAGGLWVKRRRARTEAALAVDVTAAAESVSGRAS